MNKEFILGSSSPRRKRLFTKMGIPFEVFIPDINENKFDHKIDPSKFVKKIADAKMNDIIRKKSFGNKILVTADTIVYLDRIITKPKNFKNAFEILNKMSGKTHLVYTGVSIKQDKRKKTFFEKTEVKFMKLTAREINKYLEKEKYHDKAGGYAIQGFGGFLIEKIKGDYYNIVGFPVNRFTKELKENFGVNVI